MSLLANLETADALVREIGEDRVTNIGVSKHTDTISIHLADEHEAPTVVAVVSDLVPDRDYPDSAFSTYVGTYRGVQVLIFGALREVAEVTR